MPVTPSVATCPSRGGGARCGQKMCRPPTSVVKPLSTPQSHPGVFTTLETISPADSSRVGPGVSLHLSQCNISFSYRKNPINSSLPLFLCIKVDMFSDRSPGRPVLSVIRSPLTRVGPFERQEGRRSGKCSLLVLPPRFKEQLTLSLPSLAGCLSSSRS